MTSKEEAHVPVLLAEAIEGLAIKPDGLYVDGTFGRGGHARAILKRLSITGRLVAFDVDKEAVDFARERYGEDGRFSIYHASFATLASQMEALGLLGAVDGILLDLGVSSAQLDQASRGFSFLRDGPLDMRMDATQGLDAATWLAEVSVQELEQVLRQYGEERYARRIARAIVQAREEAPIRTTGQLAEIVSDAHPAWERHKHPATRVFQAIRIQINAELQALQQCLEQSVQVLKRGGRLVVISFHSLEDRMVKQFIHRKSRGDDFPPDFPVRASDLRPEMKWIGKAIKPRTNEVRSNVRARSAVLRIAEKIV